jgi:hypothetical protein
MLSEPEWIFHLPDGDVKNLSITSYVSHELDHDPVIATK